MKKNQYGIHKDTGSIGYVLEWGTSSQLDINDDIPMEDVAQIICLLNREKSDISNCGKVDKKLVIELLDEHTEAFCETIENKHYNLITGSQLVNIISGYMKRSKKGETQNSKTETQLKDAIDYLKKPFSNRINNKWLVEVRRFIDEVEAEK